MTHTDEQPSSTPLFDTAAGWALRRDRDDWTDDDEQRFDAWLAADPGHRAAYAEVERVYGYMGRSMAPHVQRVAAEHRTGRSRRGWFVATLATAAALAIAATVAMTALSPPPVADPVAYRTVIGELREAELSDGSRLTLDADTLIEWRHTPDARRVTLMRGRAIFDVRHDPQRPFTVDAGDVSVRVVGTVFCVDRRATAVQVTVAEGEVAVGRTAADTDPADTLTLTPGQGVLVRAGATDAVTVTEVDPNDFAAWRSGRLIFHDRPLHDVAAEVERYIGTQVEVRGVALRDFKLSGSFDRKDLSDLFATLELVLPVQVRRPDPRLIVVEPRSTAPKKKSDTD